MDYNRDHASNDPAWHQQFCSGPFPRYWSVIYDILAAEHRESSVAEIGCGYGDVVAIPLYLGFPTVVAYERDSELAVKANQKLASLFSRRVVVAADAYGVTASVDILIMANCVYVDSANSHSDYLRRLRTVYEHFGEPRRFIYEAVTFAPEERRDVFPEFVWVNSRDIADTFPGASITEVETYHYPKNSTTKKIFGIERTIP